MHTKRVLLSLDLVFLGIMLGCGGGSGNITPGNNTPPPPALPPICRMGKRRSQP